MEGEADLGTVAGQGGGGGPHVLTVLLGAVGKGAQHAAVVADGAAGEGCARGGCGPAGSAGVEGLACGDTRATGEQALLAQVTAQGRSGSGALSQGTVGGPVGAAVEQG